MRIINWGPWRSKASQKKRKPILRHVVAHLTHGSQDMPDITDVIDIGEGERFKEDFRGLFIYDKDGKRRRFIDYRPGYTVKLAYFYDDEPYLTK